MSEAQDSREARQRSRILTAAGRCFAKNGFKGATIEEIAAAASLSRPVLYKHFDGKEALIDAVLEATFEEWLETNSTSEDDGHDECLAELRTKIRESVRFAQERPALQAILRQEPRVLVADHAERFRQCHERSLQRTVSLLESGRKRGEIRADIDLESTAQGVEMILFALVERAIGIRKDYPFSEAMLESSLDVLIDGLRPRSSPG